MVFDIFCILMHQNIEKILHNNSIQNAKEAKYVCISFLIKSKCFFRSPGQQKALRIHIFVMHFDMLIKVGFMFRVHAFHFIVFCVSPFFRPKRKQKICIDFQATTNYLNYYNFWQINKFTVNASQNIFNHVWIFLCNKGFISSIFSGVHA